MLPLDGRALAPKSGSSAPVASVRQRAVFERYMVFRDGVAAKAEMHVVPTGKMKSITDVDVSRYRSQGREEPRRRALPLCALRLNEPFAYLVGPTRGKGAGRPRDPAGSAPPAARAQQDRMLFLPLRALAEQARRPPHQHGRHQNVDGKASHLGRVGLAQRVDEPDHER